MVIRDGHSAVTSHLCGSVGHDTAGVKNRECSITCVGAYEPVDMPHCVHRDQETSLGVGPCFPSWTDVFFTAAHAS